MDDHSGWLRVPPHSSWWPQGMSSCTCVEVPETLPPRQPLRCHGDQPAKIGTWVTGSETGEWGMAHSWVWASDGEVRVAVMGPNSQCTVVAYDRGAVGDYLHGSCVTYGAAKTLFGRAKVPASRAMLNIMCARQNIDVS